ncbi:MAG: mechanosensitive ion channel family protein [Planctomycetota bacterium]
MTQQRDEPSTGSGIANATDASAGADTDTVAEKALEGDFGGAADEAMDTINATLEEILQNFLGHLPLLVAGLLILLVTFVLAWIARRIAWRLLVRVRVKRSLKTLVVRFVSLGVWFLGVLLAAMVTFPGISPADALAGLGIGSIAVGLAFRDIFENFFAGVLILWRFPFENGDWIACKGITGRVVDVTVRNTTLKTTEGELVLIPNVDLYKNPVDVLTHDDSRRTEIAVGVAYDTDLSVARDTIAKALSSCKSINASKDTHVLASAFGPSSIDFDVVWWTDPTPMAMRESRDEVTHAIKRALDDANITIPFPQRTLSFLEPLDVTRKGDGQSDA